jgi:hypothetical protein
MRALWVVGVAMVVILAAGNAKLIYMCATERPTSIRAEADRQYSSMSNSEKLLVVDLIAEGQDPVVSVNSVLVKAGRSPLAGDIEGAVGSDARAALAMRAMALTNGLLALLVGVVTAEAFRRRVPRSVSARAWWALCFVPDIAAVVGCGLLAATWALSSSDDQVRDPEAVLAPLLALVFPASSSAVFLLALWIRAPAQDRRS